MPHLQDPRLPGTDQLTDLDDERLPQVLRPAPAQEEAAPSPEERGRRVIEAFLPT